MIFLAHGEIHLLTYSSKVSFDHQLLLVAIAYRKRTIPPVWTWVKSSRGHSSPWKQCALLAYVYRLIPLQTTVTLAGDAEFRGIEVQKLLQSWGWK